jgi:hypothetical protein
MSDEPSPESDGPTPRTRENRLPRNRLTSPSVGDERYELTCPRCGWPCRDLRPVYWASPWNALGGLCGQCCQDAAAVFDEVGWPDER